MSSVKIYEFAPEQATDTTVAGTATDGSTADGVRKILADYMEGKSEEGLTSWLIGGNLYVAVATSGNTDGDS